MRSIFSRRAATTPVLPQRWKDVPAADQPALLAYLASDRTPLFSHGYTEFKEQLVLDASTDPQMVETFRNGRPLPSGYGAHFDERIVEYPWVFSRLPPAPVAAEGEGPTDLQQRQLIVDAGSTFNKPRLLSAPFLAGRPIAIATMETDRIAYDPFVSFLFTDLRRMMLRDEVAHVLVCISTLEHVGFTYEYQTYSRRNPWPHARPSSYLDAIREFRRVLAPGGRFLLTVPFGRYEDHGWLQQFDLSMIEEVKKAFGGRTASETVYRYLPDGWQVAAPADCADLSYFNIHESGKFDADGAVAARAVYCLELEK